MSVKHIDYKAHFHFNIILKLNRLGVEEDLIYGELKFYDVVVSQLEYLLIHFRQQYLIWL